MFWKKKDKTTYFEYFIKIAEQISESAALLSSLFNDPATAKEKAEGIANSEHIADKAVHDVFVKLNSSGFILPLDREDIYHLVKRLDDVIDYIHDTSVAYHEIYCLNDTNPTAEELAKLVLQSANAIFEITKLLHSPSENGKRIRELCAEVHRVENLADDLKKEGLKNLYGEFQNHMVNTPQYLAWNEIYTKLETTTDLAEDCSNVAEQIILKYS